MLLFAYGGSEGRGAKLLTKLNQQMKNMQPVRKAVSYRGLFTAGWFGVREKHCSGRKFTIVYEEANRLIAKKTCSLKGKESKNTHEVSAHHDISSSIGKALSRKRTNLTNSTCNLKHSLNLHLNKNWIANVTYLCVTMHPIHSFSVMLQNDNSIHAPRSRIIPPKNQERQQTRNY